MIVLASDYVGLRVVQFLLGSGYEVTAIGTHPADRGGFNEQIASLGRSAVNIEVLAADELSNPDLLARLTARKPRIGVLAWWPSILRGPIRELPAMGWINLHPSLLPHHRGRNPNFWTIADDTAAGVSIHFVDDGIDSGPVVAQRSFDVGWEDTGGSVYRASREQMLALFRDEFGDILTGKAEPKDQVSAGPPHRFDDMIEASNINLDAPTTARRVLNVVRARMFPPHDLARFRDRGRTYSVEVTIRDVTDDV